MNHDFQVGDLVLVKREIDEKDAEWIGEVLALSSYFQDEKTSDYLKLRPVCPGDDWLSHIPIHYQFCKKIGSALKVSEPQRECEKNTSKEPLLKNTYTDGYVVGLQMALHLLTCEQQAFTNKDVTDWHSAFSASYSAINREIDRIGKHK